MGAQKGSPLANRQGEIIIQCIDRSVFIGEREEDIVSAMRKSSFVPSVNEFEYMVQYAERAAFFVDLPIRTEHAGVFIRDCVQAGMMRRLTRVPVNFKQLVRA